MLDLKSKSVIDLSHTLDPRTEKRHVHVEYVTLENYPKIFPGYVVTEADKIYPMHTVEFASHIGTHLETPYHWNRRGRDCADIPAERLIGDAVVLDLRDVAPEDEITVEHVKAAAEKVGGINKGEMVFCHTVDKTNQEKRAPFFSTEAVKWLVSQGMSVFAVCAEMEDLVRFGPDGDFPNHDALFSHDCLLIEYVTNLEALKGPRFTAIALPIKIVGLDSCPIRLIAVQ
ncbi:cyclase family protein [Pelagibacterium montanilacus]|uniref:cyclase family protein n=1 Tax=Pelagibacterium montanilacus TaxID=2185280 RepID=UPI000F8F47E9|nr:cyclase family protein [Pelagibacterium montanilacus]